MELKTCVVLVALLGVASAQFFFNQPRRRPQQQPRQQFVQQNRQQFSAGQQQIGSGGVDDHNGDSQYHYSWRHGRNSFTGQQARSYCRNLGGSWVAVSINDASENSFINRVIQGESLQYIWTGGFRSGGGFSWMDGTRVGYDNWSHTGGQRTAQPDNRERRQGGNSEDCLAVLNNFYNDGVKWHDVECSHRKPVICEKKA